MSLAVGGFAGKIGAIVTPLIAQVSFKDNIFDTHEIRVKSIDSARTLVGHTVLHTLNCMAICQITIGETSCVLRPTEKFCSSHVLYGTKVNKDVLCNRNLTSNHTKMYC